MSEIINEILKALPPWLAIQFIGFAGVTYAVMMAMKRGERDRKSGGHNDATPRWYATEQNLDLLRDIKDLLHDIKTEQHNQTSVLEQIANENMINPRRLQE